ncbi:MAG: serine hydroxymethyltransferase [Devosia sp.]
MADGEVYFEFVQVGQQMRVAAIDAVTGIEVIVITPVIATKFQMQQMALSKLRKRLGEETAGNPTVPSPGRGKLA